jgi:hypothetical protein
MAMSWTLLGRESPESGRDAPKLNSLSLWERVGVRACSGHGDTLYDR